MYQYNIVIDAKQFLTESLGNGMSSNTVLSSFLLYFIKFLRYKVAYLLFHHNCLSEWILVSLGHDFLLTDSFSLGALPS